MRYVWHCRLPDRSTLLAGRRPPDETGFTSERLQIWYNKEETSWIDAGEPPHKDARSDECFIVLRGALVVQALLGLFPATGL